MNGVNGHDAMLDLIAVYALGALGASEHRLVTAHLLECATCRAEFDALRPAADAVGLIAQEPVDSARSARLKERLMATVRAEAASPKVVALAASGRTSRANVVWGAGLAAAAAVVFALVSTIQNFSLRSDLAAAQRKAGALQRQIAQNDRRRAIDREIIADLVAADAQRFPVPQGEVVKHGNRVYLALRTLPALPKGKVYQAWTLAKGAKTVAPSVTFVPNAGGVAVVALPENADTLAAVALSVEPEGGSKAPTSKPTFIRPLS